MPEGNGYHCARSAASTVAEGASASLLPAEFCPPLGTAAQVGQVNVWQAQSPCGFAGVNHVEAETTRVAVEPLGIIAAPVATNATDQ